MLAKQGIDDGQGGRREHAARPARVVSVTPIALERDSRTLKFAASVARLGFDSVVVEGERSSFDRTRLPFRLISASRASPLAESAEGRPAGSEPEGNPRPSPPARIATALPEPLALPVRRVAAAVIRSLAQIWANVRDYVNRNRETGRLLPDAEVYWLHHFFQIPAVYRRARRVGALYLYDAPDAYWEPGQTPVEGLAMRAVVRSYEAIERFSVRRADGFTTVSEGVAGLLERRFGRRPSVIRNCHDPRIDEDPEGDARTAAGLSPQDFLLVMTGNLKPGVGVTEALVALRDLPDRVHIAFVGRAIGLPQEVVRQLDESERVHLLGPVPPSQVVGFIRTADAALILYQATSENYVHALPNRFFHAVAAGLPLLFPPLKEMRALATKHELGIEIDPDDPASIAAGVSSLIAESEAAARYRARVEAARKVLSWDGEERVLAELLATPAP